MRHFRFFLSSPGDVGEERTLAQQVIEQELPKDPLVRGQISCEVIRWDDPSAPIAMPATLTPQEAVNRGAAKPSECDAVIVILWSRLGTPLPDAFKRADGTRYLSGTEWEYEDALNAKTQPQIYVYHRKSEPHFGYPTDPTFDEKVSQYRKVQEFFNRFRNADGSLKGGYAEYETPQGFRDRLRIDLKAFVGRRLETSTPRVKAPPPYREISKELNTGRIVLVIGAGASGSGHPDGARWNPQKPAFLPSGGELARFLADDTRFPSEDERDDLAEVASYYEAFQTRATLRERLRQVLGPDALADAAIPSLYQFLAEVRRPLLILTANYDTQLERAFQAANKPYDLVVYGADRKDLANAVLWWPADAVEPKTPPPNELLINLETTTVIFKMHGSIRPGTDEWDSFVITEADYVDFISRVASRSAIPTLFLEYCQERSLLFLGYSLRDWNSRVILGSLSRYFARRSHTYGQDENHSWAIGEYFSELEVDFWRKRGVYPYEVSIDEFVSTLRAKMPT